MRPAHERLEADDLAVAVDDRLVEVVELAMLDRGPQLALGLEPSQRAIPHCLVEELEPRAPSLLGAVHGRVGVAQQGLGVGARLGQGDADARRDDALMPAEDERAVQSHGEALDELERRGLAGDVLAQQHELVAPHPRHRVARP